jgi:hypothetical protein
MNKLQNEVKKPLLAEGLPLLDMTLDLQTPFNPV